MMETKRLKGSRSPIRVLLFGVMLSHLGTYMVIPLLPIFLKVQKEMTITEIGLILAVSPFTYQGEPSRRLAGGSYPKKSDCCRWGVNKCSSDCWLCIF